MESILEKAKTGEVCYNFAEISRIQRKFDAVSLSLDLIFPTPIIVTTNIHLLLYTNIYIHRPIQKALTSIIASASRIVPCSTEPCIKKDAYGIEEQVAIVKFKSEHDAYKAVEKMKLNPTFKSWSIKLITDPESTNPEAEAIRKWLN